MNRCMLLISMLVVFGCSIASSNAQVVIGSGANDTQTHAWAVYTNANDEIVLVHLPPRDGDPNARIQIEPAEPGEIHAMRPLGRAPEAIVGLDEQVYLVFPESYSKGRRVRRVLSGRVVHSAVGSIWNFLPRGRLDAEPAIKVLGELAGLCTTPKTVWALIRDDEKTENQHTLLRLSGSSWDPIELPSLDTDWDIASLGSQLVAIDRSGARGMEIYGFQPDGGWANLGWDRINGGSEGLEFHSASGRLILIDRDADSFVRIRAWSQAGVFTIASGLEIPEQTRFTVLESANRLVGVAKVGVLSASASDDDADTESDIRVIEIDLADGSVLYSGDPVVSTPVSAAEMRFLVGMMVLVMCGVLVVVIMPDKSDAMGIPDGFELADPGRRLMATIIDVFLVSMMIGLIFDVRAIEILSLSVIVRSDSAWLAIPMMLVSGVVIMSLMEWLFGASVGKFFVGIRVVKAKGGAMERIGLGSAIVRNIIKWILPPVAALALVDPEMLHRGDRATRTIVASPIRNPEKTKDSEQES